MKAKTQRLWILVVSLACLVAAAGLILYAFQENITFFYKPSELSLKEIPAGQRIRLGGMVVQDSVSRKGLQLNFAVTDYSEQVQVEFEGIAPDLFREGQGVVAEGYLVQPGLFRAVTLLAKHDENYMPPELAQIKQPEK
jgi:cytochrome c-type biogenesis protein CcmE